MTDDLRRYLENVRTQQNRVGSNLIPEGGSQPKPQYLQNMSTEQFYQNMQAGTMPTLNSGHNGGKYINGGRPVGAQGAWLGTAAPTGLGRLLPPRQDGRGGSLMGGPPSATRPAAPGANPFAAKAGKMGFADFQRGQASALRGAPAK